MKIKYLHFDDLKAAGIVQNRVTLSRWINKHGFPKGILLGPNTRAWPEESVLDWLKTRPADTHANFGVRQSEASESDDQ